MHRKKIRRWHKLLSVSGIVVAVFGLLYVPAANAQLGGPTPDGIYGPEFSKDDAQMLYLDFPGNVVGLQTADLYITGSSTGCVIDSIPQVTAFSFGVWIRGCSDGDFRVNLKAESVAFQNGITGPTVDYIGAQTRIDRTPLVLEFINVPQEVKAPRIEWQLAVNHPMVYTPYYNISLDGAGCNLVATSPTTYGLSIVVDGCLPGATATIILNPQAIQDRFGNTGPQVTTTSPTVSVNYTAPTASPSPTPYFTPSPSPSSTPITSPTASPTSSPTASPSSSPTPSSSTTASPVASPVASPSQTEEPVAAIVTPPIDPPMDPPMPPVVAMPETEAPVWVAPPEPELISEPAISLPAISISRSRILAVRKAISSAVKVQPQLSELPQVVQESSQMIQIPAVETAVKTSFNWQPIGYLAISFGGAAGAVGGGLILQRMAKMRRLRFS